MKRKEKLKICLAHRSSPFHICPAGVSICLFYLTPLNSFIATNAKTILSLHFSSLSCANLICISSKSFVLYAICSSVHWLAVLRRMKGSRFLFTN